MRRAWAERVLATFQRSSGAAARIDAGEFVDLAVARQAATILQASEQRTDPA
jgi:citrate lyase beta subunit